MSERADRKAFDAADRREDDRRSDDRRVTANDRFKGGESNRFWMAVAVAVGVHALVFATGVGLHVERFEPAGDETRGLRAVRLMPAVEIPEPPAPVARPAVPKVEAVKLELEAEDLSIEPMELGESLAVKIPRPDEARTAEEAMAGYRHWSPMMVRPKLKNPDEVRRALERRYPAHLVRAGVTGRVIMWFWIDESGAVQKYEIKESSGNEALDRAAEEVVEIMEFRPAVNHGKPAKVIVALPITFRVP